MATEKRQFCFNCGEYVGTFANDYGDVITCGSAECEREARNQEQCERDRRMLDAMDDDYRRY